MLRDEIRCLELTLAKRKAQLREADRLLKECNTDLKCARDEVRMDGLVSYSSMGMLWLYGHVMVLWACLWWCYVAVMFEVKLSIHRSQNLLVNCLSSVKCRSFVLLYLQYND